MNPLKLFVEESIEPSADWLLAKDALRQARSSDRDQTTEAHFSKYLGSGLIRSRARRALVSWASLKSVSSNGDLAKMEPKILRESQRGGGRLVTENCCLPSSFWPSVTGEPKQWYGYRSFPFGGGYWADWDRSEFAEIGDSVDDESDDFDDPRDCIVYCLRAYGVEFLASDLVAIFPPKKFEAVTPTGRPEKFDLRIGVETGTCQGPTY